MPANQVLISAGLTEKQATIYQTLLESGPATIAGIAKKSGLYRPAIYQEMPQLIAKGLITIFPKGKQRLYVAESPQKIQKLFDALAEDFQRALPEMEETFSSRSRRPKIKFLEGRKGLAHVFEDLVTSLKKNDLFYRYSAPRGDLNKGEKYLPKNYRQVRDQKQLERFVITTQAVAKQKKPRLERSIKIVPAEYGLFDFGITQLIYGDKIAILDYNTETALIIENATIAEFQKKIFKLLFDKL